MSLSPLFIPLPLLFFALFFFLPLTLAQPPRLQGKDQQFLRPRTTTSYHSVCPTVHVRTLTGECTSSLTATWGSAQRPQFSYLTPTATSVHATVGLPSARFVSNTIFNQQPGDSRFNSHGLNLLFVFFAQFVDHNMVTTPQNKADRMDIPIPDDDMPSVRARKTFPFERSMRANVGSSGAQRPLNTLSSALDLDAVYAANTQRNINALRGFDATGEVSAFLKTSGDELLPLNMDKFVNAPDISNRFFIAGDHRSNEHPVLTAFHTIFLREHNRLVREIRNRVGTNVAHVLYDAARAMNIAQFQKIVFEQFYPSAIGSPLPPYTGYKPGVDATISDVFSGAAYRFGHTMVSNTVPRRNAGNVKLPSVPMAQLFFRTASTFSTSFMEDILRGTAHESAQEVDTYVVDALRNQLFENVDGEDGFDLISINLQRSRDHALPSYNRVRQLFGFPPAGTFSQITRKREVAERLSRGYNGRVDDVELFVGLLAEDHVPGSTFGRTMNAMWKREFTRLRDGDQFHYLLTDKLPPLVKNHFKDWIAKLQRREGITLKDIIIQNSGITDAQLPRSVFKVSRVGVSSNIPFNQPSGSSAASSTVAPRVETIPQRRAPETTTSSSSPALQGLCTSKVCCERRCGSCGGSGCGRRPGGKHACCTSRILRSGRICGRDAPPCVHRKTSPTATRVCNHMVCCPASCGSCGGARCGARPGGKRNCCTSVIMRSRRRCGHWRAPCII